MVWVLVAFVLSRPFVWGIGSKRAEAALGRILMGAPEASESERATLQRSLVRRDRWVVAGAIAAVVAIEILLAVSGGIPPAMIVLNEPATHLVFALFAAQVVVAIVVSLQAGIRSAAQTERPTGVAVARARRASVADYSSRAATVLPWVLLVVALLLNVVVAVLLLRGDVASGYSVASFAAFAAALLVWLGAQLLSVLLVGRSVRSRTGFGIFAADFARAEAVGALLALAATVAAAACYVTFYPISTLFLAGDLEQRERGVILLLVPAIAVYTTLFVVLFRGLFRADRSLAVTRRLWASREELKHA